MFNKVLYPTDFSECSESVIPYIKRLKDSGTKEVIVVHVVDSRYGGFIETVGWFGETIQQFETEMYDNITRDAVKKLEKILKELTEINQKLSHLILIHQDENYINLKSSFHELYGRYIKEK